MDRQELELKTFRNRGEKHEEEKDPNHQNADDQPKITSLKDFPCQSRPRYGAGSAADPPLNS